MPSDILFWIIGFLFFQPLHLGLPILYLFIYSKQETRSAKINRVLMHGIISSALLFSAAAWLFKDHQYLAIGLVLISIPLPWFALRDKTAAEDS